MISAVSLRTWSLAVRAMALLVQPTVRVPPQAPSPPLSLPVEPQQAALAPAPHNPLFPPRCSHSRLLCLPLPLHLRWQWWALQLHQVLSQSHQPSHLNTFSPQLHLGLWPRRNAASSPAGLVHLLLLRLPLFSQVRFYTLLKQLKTQHQDTCPLLPKPGIASLCHHSLSDTHLDVCFIYLL